MAELGFVYVLQSIQVVPTGDKVEYFEEKYGKNMARDENVFLPCSDMGTCQPTWHGNSKHLGPYFCGVLTADMAKILDYIQPCSPKCSHKEAFREKLSHPCHVWDAPHGSIMSIGKWHIFLDCSSRF